jgi:hypothetical protein
VELARANREEARRLGLHLPLRTGVTLADAEGAEEEGEPMVWVQENTAPGEENGTPGEENIAPGEEHAARPAPPPRHGVTIEDVEDEDEYRGQGGNRDEGEDLDDECGAPFVEEFIDARAGQPIDESRAPPFDLRAHMASVGPFASPKHFEVAELLMTTKMTNASRDEHLKSRKVSQLCG